MLENRLSSKTIGGNIPLAVLNELRETRLY